jgi:hypothetical protein
MDQGRAAQSTVVQRWHGLKASERGGTLIGAWPIGGGTTDRGELSSALTGARTVAWRSGNVGETVEERKLGNSGARASEEGESEMQELR